MSKIDFRRYTASPKTVLYIEQLLIDLGLLHHRKDMIQLRFQKNYLDELTQPEASQFIEELKEMKNR